MNLSTPTRNAICYISAHVAVLHDFSANTEKALQGHCHPIVGLTTDPARSLIISADVGPNAMLIIWDAHTGEPLHTVPAPTPYGFRALDLSTCGTLLAAVTAPPQQQVVAWRLVREEGKSPVAVQIAAALVRSQDPQRCIRFAPSKPAPNVVTFQGAHDESTESATGDATDVGGDPTTKTSTSTSTTTDLSSPTPIYELLTQGRKSVFFWERHTTHTDRLVCSEPLLIPGDFKQAIGEFTSSSFIPGTNHACTGTVDGDLVVWTGSTKGEHGPGTERQGTKPGTTGPGMKPGSLRTATMVVRVHQAPVTFVTHVKGQLVTGGGDGFVRVFDAKIRLLSWYERIGAGAVTTVAFAQEGPTSKLKGGGHHDDDYEDGEDEVDGDESGVLSPDAMSYSPTKRAQVAARAENGDKKSRTKGERLVPDFCVTTTQAKIVLVPSVMFEAPAVTPSLLMSGVRGQIVTLTAHPTQPKFMLTTKSGRIEVWNWETSTLEAEGNIASGFVVTCATYSRNGQWALFGTASGHVHVFETARLKEVTRMRQTRDAITNGDFGIHLDRFAVIDDAGLVMMYSLEKIRGQLQWEFLGKYRGHPGSSAAGLAFVCPAGADAPAETLVTCGKDGSVAEYDVLGSTMAEGMHLIRHLPRGTLSRTPACIGTVPTDAPVVPWASDKVSLVVADDGYGLQVLDTGLRRVTSSSLGPTFGGPLQQLTPFTASTGTSCVAYALKEKICGVVVAPLDGCPAKCLGVIAHPGNVADMAVAHDGSRIFTASAEDAIVNVWKVNGDEVAALSARGGSLADWAPALEGGLGGASFQQLKDMFWYFQILAEGEASDTAKTMTGYIPTPMLEQALPAVGVYPTREQLVALMAEHKARTAARFADDKVTAKKESERVSLLDLVRFFVNHRPLGEFLARDVEEAFAALQRWTPREVSEPSVGDVGGSADPQGSMLNASLESLDGGAESSGVVFGAERLPEEMIRARALYRERIFELLARYGDAMSVEDFAAVGMELHGDPDMASLLPEVCDPGSFLNMLGFVKD